MQKRREVKPLYLPGDIYRTLSPLQVGESVPSTVYISDYSNGVIPVWQVVERQEVGAGGVILTLIDQATFERPSLWNGGRETWVGKDIFCFPEKTLAGIEYCYFAGCGHARHMLHDIRQEARKMAERHDKVKRGAYVNG
jgi:hypothetical protein